MKRLLDSSKFWVTVIGTVAASIAYAVFDDQAFALTILGTFTAVVVANAGEDMYKARKNGN